MQRLQFSIQHSAFSIQHSAFSIQHSAFSIRQRYEVWFGSRRAVILCLERRIPAFVVVLCPCDVDRRRRYDPELSGPHCLARGNGLAEAVYQVTAEFPAAERFGLSSQLRQAAVSIVSNIAEGRGRRSTKDFKRFVDIAYGSLCELETQLHWQKDCISFRKKSAKRPARSRLRQADFSTDYAER